MRRWTIVLLALFVAAVPEARAGETVAFQVNAAHDGHLAGETLPAQMGLKWRFEIPDASISHPIVAGGRVIVAASFERAADHPYGSRIIAISAEDGRQLWARDIAHTYYRAGLAYEDGRVFVTTFDGEVLALAADSGAVLWSRDLGDDFLEAPPAAAGGTVYVTLQGVLHALAGDSGQTRWSKTVGAVDQAAPAVGGDRVFVNGQFGVKALAASGGGGWTHEHDAVNPLTPVLAGGRLYVRTRWDDAEGSILDAASGAPVGSFVAWTVPAIAEGIALFGNGTVLRAVELASGRELWRIGQEGVPLGAPLIAGGRVYVTAGGREAVSLDLRTGAVQWRCQAAGAAGVAVEGSSAGGQLQGLGAGGGLLVVPASGAVLAYGDGGACTPPPAGAPVGGSAPPPPAPAPAGSGFGSPQSLQAPGTVQYGGGLAPTRRRAGLAMSLARAGDQVLVRAGIPISCHRTSVPQLIVRAKGTASGDTFTASVRSRVLPRLSLDFAVQGRFSGDTAEGTVTVRGVRRKGGPRGCGIRRSATVRLRTEVSPQAAPVPAPRGASLRGLSTGTAAGVRLPVLVSVTSTGRVIARWLAQPACARGSLSVDNYTPSTRVDATGRFAKAERYTVRYRDGTADHYRVRFDGRFRADGVAGTLRARVRVTGRGGRTLARCDSGLQRYGAA